MDVQIRRKQSPKKNSKKLAIPWKLKNLQFYRRNPKNDPKIEWSASLISNKILDYIAENNIKAMITYDEYGSMEIIKILLLLNH